MGAIGGEAVSLGNLGEIDSLRGRLDRAEQRLTASLTALREAGHRGGQAEVLRCLAEARRDEGDRAAALGLAQAALDLASETRIRRTEIACRRTLGTILRCLGDGAAVEEYERALVMARADGDGYHLSSCLTGLADAYRASGEGDRALRLATEAVSVARRGAYRLREADAVGVVAATLAEGGRCGQVARAATLSSALYRDCGVRHAAATCLALRRACG